MVKATRTERRFGNASEKAATRFRVRGEECRDTPLAPERATPLFLLVRCSFEGIRLDGSASGSLRAYVIVTEYDYEMELLSQIRREGGKALISSYANSLTENSFQIAELNLEETLAAMVKHRYGKQQLVNGSWVDVWP